MDYKELDIYKASHNISAVDYIPIYSTWMELYLMMTILMTGYSFPLINESVPSLVRNLKTGSSRNLSHRFIIVV